MIAVTQQGGDVLFPVKVVPNASRERIVGELDGALKVAVSAAPEKGRANRAVCRLIASRLGLRPNQVVVDAGHTSPRKTIRITSSTLQAVRDLLLNPS